MFLISLKGDVGTVLAIESLCNSMVSSLSAGAWYRMGFFGVEVENLVVDVSLLEDMTLSNSTNELDEDSISKL